MNLCGFMHIRPGRPCSLKMRTCGFKLYIFFYLCGPVVLLAGHVEAVFDVGH